MAAHQVPPSLGFSRQEHWSGLPFPSPMVQTSVAYAMLCYAKSLQSCPTLCAPRDGSPHGSPIPGILQAKTLEWVAILLQCMKVKSEREVARSCPTLSDPMDCSHQAPPSMGFSRQEYWIGVPLPSPLKQPRHGAYPLWLTQCSLA